MNPNLAPQKTEAVEEKQRVDESKPEVQPTEEPLVKDSDAVAITTEANQPPQNEQQVQQEQKPQEEGDKATSFFDPAKPIEISMDSEGDLSLATIPQEYAKYFIQMQEQIGRNWRRFFPVFQYYQGLIKSGDVVVNFQIDPDGNILGAQIAKSYGYGVIDQSALNAVQYTGNVGALPEIFQKNGNIAVNFKFVYVAR